MRINTLLCLGALLLPTFLMSQSPCEQILKFGIFDKEDVFFSQNNLERYLRWIDKKEFQSRESLQSSQTETGISFPIDAVPAELSFKGNKGVQLKEQKYTSFSDFMNKNNHLKTNLVRSLQTANADLFANMARMCDT